MLLLLRPFRKKLNTNQRKPTQITRNEDPSTIHNGQWPQFHLLSSLLWAACLLRENTSLISLNVLNNLKFEFLSVQQQTTLSWNPHSKAVSARYIKFVVTDL